MDGGNSETQQRAADSVCSLLCPPQSPPIAMSAASSSSAAAAPAAGTAATSTAESVLAAAAAASSAAPAAPTAAALSPLFLWPQPADMHSYMAAVAAAGITPTQAIISPATANTPTLAQISQMQMQQPASAKGAYRDSSALSEERRPWTKDEDARVMELVAKFGTKVSGGAHSQRARSFVQLQRFSICRSLIRSDSWSNLFTRTQKWSLVGSNLDGRTGKQCRERWHNHLNPGQQGEEREPVRGSSQCEGEDCASAPRVAPCRRRAADRGAPLDHRRRALAVHSVLPSFSR